MEEERPNPAGPSKPAGDKNNRRSTPKPKPSAEMRQPIVVEAPAPPAPSQIPAHSAPAIVPSSVTKRGSSKLNPAASEFKPASISVSDSSGSHPQPAGEPSRTISMSSKATARKGGRQGSSGKRKPINVSSAENVTATPLPTGQEAGIVNKASNRKTQGGKKHSSASPAATVDTHAEEPKYEIEELTCTICTDTAKFFAVGRCNHHICSMCAVRMRVKSKDRNCAICKENLNMMVVFQPQIPKASINSTLDSAQILRPFNSFGLNDADCDADHSNLPGVRVDVTAGLLFVDCAQHFTEMDQLRAIICPITTCKARFPSVKTLQKHLHELHGNMSLCTLCVENRPLFISEHRVMTPKQLAAHMKGEDHLEQGLVGSHQSANVHTTGHPSCQFCTERFFDKAALYYHMQRSYFTCHLCPRQHMFRYYVDASALRDHHQREHIVCNICAAVPQLIESGVAVAFRDAREYSEHMRQIHNTQVSGMGGSGSKTSFRLGASSTYQTSVNNVRRDKHGHPRVTVVDLDMGSADPNARTDHSTSTPASSRSSNTTATPALRADGVAHLIPANMRIAGRVTGAGRFAELDSSDLLMQAAAEEYAASERQARSGKKSIRLDREEAFPALDGSAEQPRSGVKSSYASTTASNIGGWGVSSGLKGTAPPLPSKQTTSSTTNLHPMSLIHAGKLQAQDLQRRKDAEAAEKLRAEKQRMEDRRIERNISLASALLGGSSAGKDSHLSLTAAEVGATLKNKSYVRSLIAPLEFLGWTESDLMRSIYPPVLVSWAKLNITELMKIERKLDSLMNDPQLNSIQLKPMDRAMRMIVHQLSRMYLLNSYEFDAEPNRYVSLVKQVDSYLPLCPLSRASAMPAFSPPGSKGEELPDVPVIFLTLSSERYSAGLVNTNSSVSNVKKSGAPGSAAVAGEPVRVAFTCAEIVSRVSGLLGSPDLWRAWYQHAILTGAPEQDLPPLPPEVDPALPSPPPGYVLISTAQANSSAMPRALADLPVPRLTGLIPAGPSSIGLRFEDRTNAQLALLFLQYCLALHHSSLLPKNAQRTTVQASLVATSSSLSTKQLHDLLVLSVFNQHPGCTPCTVTEVVFGASVGSSSTKAPAMLPAQFDQPIPAVLDRRHFTSKSKEKALAEPAEVTTQKVTHHDDGWVHQAVKTRRFEDNDYDVTIESMPLQESWEDLEQIPDLDTGSDTRKISAGTEVSDDGPGKDEEWEQFLADRQSRAKVAGAASAPKYEPKRTNSASSATSASSASQKYIPPSARKAGGGIQAVKFARPSAVVEEEYDLCDRSLNGTTSAGTTDVSTSTPAVTPAVYVTDYLDSEEAFEEFLRKTRLEHVNGGAIEAVPFNPLTQVAPTRGAARVAAGMDGVARNAMTAIAVPISEGMTHEEAVRIARRSQLQRDQSNSQLNRFGILDEDEADEEDGDEA